VYVVHDKMYRAFKLGDTVAYFSSLLWRTTEIAGNHFEFNLFVDEIFHSILLGDSCHVASFSLIPDSHFIFNVLEM
jgi:hypothetical protein